MQTLTKLAWVETKLFLREPVTLVLTFASPLFVLSSVFGDEVDREEPQVWRGVAPTEYYAPAYVALVVSTIGLLSLPVHLAAYRERGVLRRFRASHIPLWAIFGAHTLVSLGMATVSAVALAATSMAVYGTSLPEALLPTLVAYLLTVLAFAAIGLLLGGLLPNARSAQAGGLLLFFVMMFIGGAGPPREVMSDALQTIGEVLPLTHAIIAIQDPWLGYGWNAGASIIVAAFAIVATGIAYITFRWE